MKKIIKIFLIIIATIAIITTMCVFASENIIYIKDGENIISSSESSTSGSFLTLKNLETKKVNVVLNSEVESLDDFEMKIEQTTGNTKIVFSKSTKELLITPSKAGIEAVIIVFENNKTNSKYVLPLNMNILAETKNVTLRSNIESLGVTQNANTLIGVANITKQIEEKNEKITELPKINLVSEDLKSNIPLNVTKITENKYKFEGSISEIKENIKYNIITTLENEGESAESKTITSKSTFLDTIKSEYSNETIVLKASNNTLLFTKKQAEYMSARLNDLKLFLSDTKLEYISGNIEAKDAKGKVSIYFLGENGERVDTWYIKNDDGSYYFDRTISGFENGKKYNLVIEAENGKKIVDLWNKKEKIGKYNVEISNSKIQISEDEEIKNMLTKLKSLNIFVSGNNLECISGNIEVKDAKGKVSIYFLGENGERVDTWYVKNDDGSYYFDRTISGFKNGKKYNLVIEAENGKKIVDLWNKKEKIGKYNIEIFDSKLQAIEDIKKIDGKLKSLNIFVSENNLEYISGNIEVKDAKGKVSIYFLGENGERVDTWYIKKDDGSYYFDRTISGFENGKKYRLVIEAESGKKIVDLWDKKENVGKYNIEIFDSKINVIEDVKKIDGKLKSLNIFVSGNNLEYISGNIEVKDAKGKVSIYFLGENGERVDTWYIKNDDGSYYFDRTISGFENDKKYNLVIEAENGKKIVDLWDKKENVGKYDVEISNSKIQATNDIIVKLNNFKLFMANGKTEYLSGIINIKNAKGNVKIIFYGPNGKTADVWAMKIDDENYYFDKAIGGFEKGITYQLVVEAENGAKKVELKDANTKIGNYNVIITDSKLISK